MRTDFELHNLLKNNFLVLIFFKNFKLKFTKIMRASAYLEYH